MKEDSDIDNLNMGVMEFDTKELVALVESKAINGKISLDDIAQIVFDSRFPAHLSAEADKKLVELSADFKRYRELGAILITMTDELIEIQDKFMELNDAESNTEDDENRIVAQLQRLRDEQDLIKRSMKPMQIEFDRLREYFGKIK